MNTVICVLAFLGSVAAYCILVLFLSAFMTIIVKHDSITDDNVLSDLCFVQFAIVVIVLALYFANMSVGIT